MHIITSMIQQVLEGMKLKVIIFFIKDLHTHNINQPH
jgi:hypothetical protein